MELIADILLVAGALGAGMYCFVLARRLKRFNDLEQGVGGAVAVLSSQVEELNRSLSAARAASEQSNDALGALTGRAEDVAKRLELMMAAMHDVTPDEAGETDASGSPATAPETYDLQAKTPDSEPDLPRPAEAVFRRHDSHHEEGAL